MADVFIMGDVSSAIDQWGLGYKHHVCTQESGAGATMDAEATEKRPAWVADSVSGGDIAIEEGTLRFLVRLRCARAAGLRAPSPPCCCAAVLLKLKRINCSRSKPTQTEPFPKHCVDIHLTGAPPSSVLFPYAEIALSPHPVAAHAATMAAVLGRARGWLCVFVRSWIAERAACIAVGAADVKDVTKMSYSIETEAMVCTATSFRSDPTARMAISPSVQQVDSRGCFAQMRMVVDEFGTPDIASKQVMSTRRAAQRPGLPSSLPCSVNATAGRLQLRCRPAHPPRGGANC